MRGNSLINIAGNLYAKSKVIRYILKHTKSASNNKLKINVTTRIPLTENALNS